MKYCFKLTHQTGGGGEEVLFKDMKKKINIQVLTPWSSTCFIQTATWTGEAQNNSNYNHRTNSNSNGNKGSKTAKKVGPEAVSVFHTNLLYFNLTFCSQHIALPPICYSYYFMHLNNKQLPNAGLHEKVAAKSVEADQLLSRSAVPCTWKGPNMSLWSLPF